MFVGLNTLFLFGVIQRDYVLRLDKVLCVKDSLSKLAVILCGRNVGECLHVGFTGAFFLVIVELDNGCQIFLEFIISEDFNQRLNADLTCEAFLTDDILHFIHFRMALRAFPARDGLRIFVPLLLCGLKAFGVSGLRFFAVTNVADTGPLICLLCIEIMVY